MRSKCVVSGVVRPERRLIDQQHRQCLVDECVVHHKSHGEGSREKVNTYGLPLLGGLVALGAGLLLALALLEQSLRDQDLVVGGDGTVCTSD
jgi:hypothetical protein